MRTYERTHPWIRFELDLRRFPHDLWLLLGEAQSKCEHIAGVPLQPATAEELNRVFLAKGVQATTAIEGNTLSEQDVRARIEGKLALPPSQEYQGREVDNIVGACNRIFRDAVATPSAVSVTEQGIRELHRQVLEGLPVDEGVVPGEYRTHQVGVARYRAAPSEDCPFLVEALAKWLSEPAFEGPPGQAIAFAVIRAVVAHVYLAWIHPFADGNGRTARLLEFHTLVHARVPMPAAHLLSNHYNATRSEYYRQLDMASASGGDLIAFLKYAVQGFVEGLRSQLERVRFQQWTVAWRDYVYEMFRSRTSRSATRQRHLVLDLAEQTSPVPRSQLSQLTPRLAAEYATKTGKTLTRDLNALEEMKLLVKEADGYRARKEIILAFLPPRRIVPPDSSRE
jgi:Fic family protein